MIVLASASPRRRELLRHITPEFDVEPSAADEDSDIKDPELLVSELARSKAADVFARRPDDTVIGADTVVYVNGEILGKPKDAADAFRMINMLSGNTHEVYTGVCVMSPKGAATDVCTTRVTFAPMSDAEIKAYVKSADIYDKAGAYAVQGEAAKYIERIDGCFYNVMGLPVRTVHRILMNN